MLYGREIPDYRTVRDHIDRLIAEGERNRQARGARPARMAIGALGFVRAMARGRHRVATARAQPRHVHE